MDSENILIIPRHQVFVKFIDVPSVQTVEIDKMADFQALKEIPHPKEDMVVSFRNLGSFKEGFSSLMMCVAGKDMINARISERHGLNRETGAIRLYSELLYLFLLKRGTVSKDKVSFVANIGKEYSEVLIIDRTRPVFSRGFKNSENFLEEIDRSIQAYKRTRDNPEIQDVVVAHSSDVDIRDAAPYIRSHFTIPVSFCEYSEDPGSVDVAAEIDLLPKEVSHKKTTLEKKKELIVTYSLLGLTIILLSGMLYYKIHEKNTLLAGLSRRGTEVSLRMQGLDGFLKKTEIVEKHIEMGSFVARVLERSYIMIPESVSFSGLNYNGGDSIFYKGTSRDMSSVFSFVKELEGSGYFEKVEVKYATKKQSRGTELTDFNIECRLRP